VAREENDDAEGLRLVKEAVSKGAKSYSIQASLGEFLVRSKTASDQKEGTKILMDLARSTERPAVLSAADAWQRLDRYKEAIESAQAGLKNFPADPDLLFRLAASLEREKRHDESVAAFEELIKVRPDHAAALNYLGYMWAEKGENLERSLALIQKAVEIEPSNGAYLDSLGWVYYQMNKLEMAEKYLLEAVRLSPDDSAVEEHLGDLYEKMGNTDKAKLHWKKALALKPDDGGKKLGEKLARSGGVPPAEKQ
jgi:tetratricopeptide (TPR) repeat protein